MDLLIEHLALWWPWWTVAAVVVALLALMRMYSQPARMPYRSRDSLVTRSELRFYRSLEKAVLDDWIVFAMVRIADLIQVEKQTPNHRTWLNKILAKHIDFVLCDPGTLKPVLAIELDDVSHNRPERMERDAFVNEAFEAAGLPLLRVPVEPSYRASEIRELIESEV